MKIMIITNHSYMLWQFRRELIAKLQENGDVIIATPFVGCVNGFEDMGCRCIETPLARRGTNPFKEIRLYRFYKKILNSEKPDIVITYSIKPNLYAGYACRKAGIPYFANVQGIGTAFQKKLLALLVTRMYRAGLKKAKTVFFENSENAKTFEKRKIVSPDRVKILSGAGVNMDFYGKQPYPDENGGIHFLFVGRIMREKGADEFFKAAKNLKSKYGDKICFDIVGFFEDDYRDTVQELSKEGVLCYHGFKTDTRPYYAMSHCVVLPSYHEGMSNVLLEAAASARPLITSDIAGCREAVDNGESGFLCRKGDADSLEECMDRFMALDRESRENMGLCGRQKMKAEFDKQRVIKQTVSAIGLGDFKRVMGSV